MTKPDRWDVGTVDLLAVGESKAARLLGLSPRTLWTLRATGRGPRYRRAGRRVIYAVRDLEAWLSQDDCTGRPTT